MPKLQQSAPSDNVGWEKHHSWTINFFWNPAVHLDVWSDKIIAKIQVLWRSIVNVETPVNTHADVGPKHRHKPVDGHWGAQRLHGALQDSLYRVFVLVLWLFKSMEKCKLELGVCPHLGLQQLPGLLHRPEPPLHGDPGRRHPPGPGSNLVQETYWFQRCSAGSLPAPRLNRQDYQIGRPCTKSILHWFVIDSKLQSDFKGSVPFFWPFHTPLAGGSIN